MALKQILVERINSPYEREDILTLVLYYCLGNYKELLECYVEKHMHRDLKSKACGLNYQRR